MRIILLILLFLAPYIVVGQNLNIENGVDVDRAQLNPLFGELFQDNDFVISFRIKNTDKSNEKSDYFILTRSGDVLSAYKYLKITGRLARLNLSDKHLKLVWDTFLQNDIFAMRNEKDIPNFCAQKYEIYNSYTYEFVLVGKGKMKTLSFYNPEYYDVACFGMEEREKIINSASVVNYILNL